MITQLFETFLGNGRKNLGRGQLGIKMWVVLRRNTTGDKFTPTSPDRGVRKYPLIFYQIGEGGGDGDNAQLNLTRPDIFRSRISWILRPLDYTVQVDGREWELPPSPSNSHSDSPQNSQSDLSKNSQSDFPQKSQSDFSKNSRPYFHTDSNISTPLPQRNHCLRSNRWNLKSTTGEKEKYK